VKRRIALLLLVPLALSGCAADAAGNVASPAPTARVALSELGPVPDPKAITGPSTAVLPDARITAEDEDPRPVLPASVTSHDRTGDQAVTVRSIDRIVAFDMAGSVAGTLLGLGLGDRIVGRDVASTETDLARVPVVTSPDGQSIDAEAVLARKPTLVLTDGSVGPIDVIQQLRKAGIPVVFVQNTSSFAGAAELARQIGAAVGLPEAGAALATRITDQVDATTAAIARLAPSDPSKRLRMVFLYLRGGSGIYYLFGSDSGASALIDALGGIDVLAELGWTGERPMTDEAMVKADPDLVLVMTEGLKSVGGIDGLLQSKPAIALTSAGQHRRFVDMADGEVLSFGPRSADVLDALARAIYAPGR
jgi:iron complex transport system substrate-binding protein